jgi:copper chaperone CopZ
MRPYASRVAEAAVGGQGVIDIFMNISDLKCAGCEATVRKRLLKLDAVYDARASFRTGKLLLSVRPDFDAAEAVAALREIGYTLSNG